MANPSPEKGARQPIGWRALWRYERVVFRYSFAELRAPVRELVLIPLLVLAASAIGGLIVGMAHDPQTGVWVGLLLLFFSVLGWSRTAAAARVHYDHVAELERLRTASDTKVEFGQPRPVLAEEVMLILAESFSSEAFFTGFLGGLFVVDVTNVNPEQVALEHVLARIQYEGESGKGEVEGFWSKVPGGRFIRGGKREATIGYGDSWALVLGLYSATERTWLQALRTDFPPNLARTEDDGVVSRHTGRRMDLGPTCRVSARLTGNHLSARGCWLLFFDEDGHPVAEMADGR